MELTADRVDLREGVIVFESLKKRRCGVFRAVSVPPKLLDELVRLSESFFTVPIRTGALGFPGHHRAIHGSVMTRSKLQKRGTKRFFRVAPRTCRCASTPSLACLVLLSESPRQCKNFLKATLELVHRIRETEKKRGRGERCRSGT